MKKVADLFRKKRNVAVTAVAGLVLAAVIGGTSVWNSVPELTSNVDPIMEMSIEEEETPLAAQPKVTTKTSKKTTEKKVKLKSASKKTYSKKLPAQKKTSTKTQNTSDATIEVTTTVTTNTVEKYTKKSKYKVVSTTVTTTVKTTTTPKQNDTIVAESEERATTEAMSKKGAIDVMSAANKMDSRVLKAYTTLGFTVSYDSSVSYSGYYDTRNRSITLKENNDTIYHELGHFLAFIAGNVDTSSSFVSVYNQEKGKYTGVNKAYVIQNSSEYFAESVRDYTLNPGKLQSSRPQTYKAIQAALDKVTDTQIKKIKLVYGRIWK